MSGQVREGAIPGLQSLDKTGSELRDKTGSSFKRMIIFAIHRQSPREYRGIRGVSGKYNSNN